LTIASVNSQSGGGGGMFDILKFCSLIVSATVVRDTSALYA